MAKVSYTLVPQGYQYFFNKALSSGDRFGVSRVRRNISFMTRRRIKGLTAKTLLPQIVEAWKALSLSEQEAWGVAGQFMGLNGYRLFVKDKTLRIKNDLAGNSTPDDDFQTMVGGFSISAPATSLKVAQFHPREYWVAHKVTGTQSTYEPVKVVEDFALPLELSANYCSRLSAVGPNPYARLTAVVYSLYQGTTRETSCVLDFDLENERGTLSEQIDWVIGKSNSYTLFIEFNDVQGDFFIDNISCFHSGQNWCRDPFCNDIDQSFTRAFYQVPKHWVGVDVPDGAFFASVFKELAI